MDELRNWLDEIPEEVDTYAGTILIGGVGAFFYIMNWLIFINNMIPGRKWSSMVPPIGGLIIAVMILILGGRWLALIGITDPCVFVIVYSLLKPHKRMLTENVNNEKDKEEKNDNGD